jgi:hypothetical protein
VLDRRLGPGIELNRHVARIPGCCRGTAADLVGFGSNRMPRLQVNLSAVEVVLNARARPVSETDSLPVPGAWQNMTTTGSAKRYVPEGEQLARDL